MARRKTPASRIDSHGIPACLQVGRLIEVWAENPEHAEGGRAVGAISSTQRRFRAVRTAWFEANAVPDSEKFKLIPGGMPWSAVYVGAEKTNERLGPLGLSVQDIPALRAEAERLLRAAAAIE